MCCQGIGYADDRGRAEELHDVIDAADRNGDLEVNKAGCLLIMNNTNLF